MTDLRLVRIDPVNWLTLAASAHRAVFNEIREAKMDANIDYALVIEEVATGTPWAYVTVQLHDPETSYWKFGGTFPPGKKKLEFRRGIMMMIQDEISRGIKRIHCFVENQNERVLQLLLLGGFRVVGTRNHDGRILVDLELKCGA